MDFTKLFEEYYENDKYQEIINIYEKNKIQIINDEDLMFCVIDSFLALKKYKEANILVEESLPALIAIIGTREMTDDEKEDLDWFLDSKIEILYETKSYFKLLILLIKHGSWLEDRELVLGMYHITKRKVYKQLFILLLAVLLLAAIGLHFSYQGSIDLMFQSYFIYIANIALGIYFIVIAIVEILSRSRTQRSG